MSKYAEIYLKNSSNNQTLFIRYYKFYKFVDKSFVTNL